MACRDRLREGVRTLTTTYRDRNVFNIHTMHDCQKWLKQKLDNKNLFTQKIYFNGKPSENIFQTLKKDDSKKVVVIGAHYDSEACSQTPGADDNASGVAAVLELAHLIRSVPTSKLRYNTVFALYTNEEWPFFKTEMMGSYQFAKFLKQGGYEVEQSLTLDMVGRYEDSQTYPPGLKYFYPDHGHFLASVRDWKSRDFMRDLKKSSELQIENLYVPKFANTFHRSDHWSFWHHGFKGVLLTDTADFRHNDYHSKSDSWEKLNYEKMSQLVDAIYATLVRR